MGLIGKKVKQKVVMPDAIIFENFADNKAANKLRLDADCKRFQKYIRPYTFNPNIASMKNEFYNFNVDMKDYLLNATGSQVFSDNLVAMLNVARLHAAIYAYDNRSREISEKKIAYLNLRKLFDIMVFITIDHVMFEKGENIEWNEEENCFLHLVDTECEELILMMTDILSNIVMLADAMCDNDNAVVFRVLNFFSDENCYRLKANIEDIFEL